MLPTAAAAAATAGAASGAVAAAVAGGGAARSRCSAVGWRVGAQAAGRFGVGADGTRVGRSREFFFARRRHAIPAAPGSSEGLGRRGRRGQAEEVAHSRCGGHHLVAVAVIIARAGHGVLAVMTVMPCDAHVGGWWTHASGRPHVGGGGGTRSGHGRLEEDRGVGGVSWAGGRVVEGRGGVGGGGWRGGARTEDVSCAGGGGVGGGEVGVSGAAIGNVHGHERCGLVRRGQEVRGKQRNSCSGVVVCSKSWPTMGNKRAGRISRRGDWLPCRRRGACGESQRKKAT